MSRARNAGTDTAIEAAIAALTSERLLQFLSRQRWFGAKGEAPTAATSPTGYRSMTAWPSRAFASSRRAEPRSIKSRLRRGANGHRRCQTAPYSPRSPTTMATCMSSMRCTIPSFVRRSRGASPRVSTPEPSEAPRWIIESAAAESRQPSGTAHTRLVGVEQSNTSIVIGDVAIIKLFRRLVPGMQPGRGGDALPLHAAGFAHTPAFLGELRFEDEHGTTTAGMTQQYVPGATDLWAYALERAAALFRRARRSRRAEPFLADAKRSVQDDARDARRAGRRNDDPSFAPEPVTRDDVDRWAHRTQQSMREALALLDRQLEASGDFRASEKAEARALAGRRDHYIGWVNEIVDEARRRPRCSHAHPWRFPSRPGAARARR